VKRLKAFLGHWRNRLWPPRQDSAPLTLSQRRIYVLPTRAGLAYAMTLMFMLIGSINYNLSLGYALTFLLAGLGIVNIVHTFRNLAGLQLSPGRHVPGFAGESLQFGVHLQSPGPRHGIRLAFRDGLAISSTFDSEHSAHLTTAAHKRGWQDMGRITISTSWPLGLIRGWAYARFDEQALVYPAPAQQVPPYPHASGEQGRRLEPEPDDFVGLRAHRPGDLRQHIAWRASARLEETLLTKQFATQVGDAVCFDLSQTPGSDIEARLSVMTRWLLDAHAEGLSYSLQLGALHIASSTGEAHLQQCLRVLALYE
jgi:uncharacterized protein (DUF58 family)